MALRIALLIIFSLTTYLSAFCQESVRRAIFEDCDQARAEYLKLTVDQQSSLIDYLTRIIALNTESPSAPEAFAVQPGAQVAPDAKSLPAPYAGDLIPGTLWQSADAKRDLRAKRCALEILESAGALAFSALPSLVTTYSEQPLSDEIAVGVEELSALIAEEAHKGASLPTNDDIKIFSRHALGPRPLVARNLIHEFKNESLPTFVLFVAEENQRISDDAKDWLRSLDPDGSLVTRAALTLLPTLTKEQALELMKNIPATSERAEALFIREFIELANSERFSTVFTQILGQACEQLKGLTLDQNLQTAISTIPGILNPNALTDSSLICLSQSSQPLAKQVKQLLIGDDAIQKTRVINLIARGLRANAKDLNSELFSALREIALNTDSADWTSAVKALASFNKNGDELTSLALQLIKQSARIADRDKAQAVTSSIFELLGSAELSREATARMMPQIVNSIRSQNPNPIAIKITKESPSIDTTLMKLALTSPPTPSSLKALEILSTRTDVADKALLPLIDLLRFPESQRFAEKSIIAIGKTAASTLRRHIPKLSSGSPKTGALGILVNMGVATLPEARELAVYLNSTGDCSFIKQRETLLCDLHHLQQTDSELKTSMTAVITRCLSEWDKEQIARVGECNPNSILETGEAIGRSLADGKLSDEQVMPIVDLAISAHNQDAKAPGADTRRSAALISQIILNGPRDAKERLLIALSEVTRLDSAVQESLRTFAGEPLSDSPISRLAILALATSGDTLYPWRDFVRASLASAKNGSLDSRLARIISRIPADQVLAEVIPALEGDQSESMVAAALVGASLGPKAVPIVSRLWNLRERRSPAVRYTASLALLQINPLTPDMHETVKKVLVNRFFRSALSMTILWKNTVAVNDLDLGTFGTLRLERLNQLNRPPAN